MWMLGYFAAGVVLAGFDEANGPAEWAVCLFLWPVVLLYTLGSTIGSYFK